jgi:chemotaxis protein methyltransferase CheR
MSAVLIAPETPAEVGIAPSGLAESEFVFGTADFERVRRLIFQRAGISLGPGKQAMVYSRLSRRLRETGQHSFSAYLLRLENSNGPAAEPEWQEFVNCLTTNLTSFFREEHHFEALAAELERRAGEHLRIWCSAASTGEEPYSIAMSCAEAPGGAPEVRIVASDIDTRVLATASRGVYLADASGLSRERLHEHFLRGKGLHSGLVRVKPELARRVEFRPLNLTDANWSLGEPFDIVFCRNVMIYFNVATQRRVLEGIHAMMKPQGLLFVGHSEHLSDASELFRPRGNTIYERV